MRPGDPSTLDNARQYMQEQLFDQRRYDLERVGRYKLNQKLDLHARVPLSHRTVTAWDILKLIERLILINNGLESPDDIDHLGNRRVKTVGELIQNKMRIGLRRTERVVRERMSIRDQESFSPMNLINIRPIVAAVREFFGSSQLSQFMDQTNPLAELRHKRTLSALGPGGLRRERAGFDVRDVHQSHYGRICPIETPEGPNIGLIGRLASYAKVNPFGFIETPYRKVYKSFPAGDARLIGRHLAEDVLKQNGKDVLVKKGELITKDLRREARPGGRRNPDRAVRLRRDALHHRRHGRQIHHRPGQRAAQRTFGIRARPGFLPQPFALYVRHARPDRLHGRGPAPDRRNFRRTDPVPGARRRQPRPDGLEHAWPRPCRSSGPKCRWSPPGSNPRQRWIRDR